MPAWGVMPMFPPQHEVNAIMGHRATRVSTGIRTTVAGGAYIHPLCMDIFKAGLNPECKPDGHNSLLNWLFQGRTHFLNWLFQDNCPNERPTFGQLLALGELSRGP